MTSGVNKPKKMDGNMIDTLSIKPTILVVEDELTQLKMMENKLQRRGYNVLTAENGLDALEVWSANVREVRIVITDLEMPKADGYHVIKNIREREELYTYLMVLTTRDDKDALIKGLGCGADDFIIKPIANEELDLRLLGARRRLRLQDYTCLVGGLAELAAHRGGETRGHLQRVKEYSGILASDLWKDRGEEGLVKQLREDVATISVLHDIGKNGVPDSLLMKRGRYTPKEYEIVKDHTVIGGDILMDLYETTGSYYLLLVYEIAKYHHEKWDGSGYPEGLKGEEIPLAARIVGFVQDYIREERGKAFDPGIIESYERNQDKFREVQNSIKDSDEIW